MSGVSVAKKNGGQTSAIFANDTRWRPNSQILHRRDRSNSRVTETARPSGVPPSAARPSGVLLLSTLCQAYLYPRPTKLEGGYTGFTLSVCPSVRLSVRPSVCRRHGFRSISQVCFGISISNFICMLMMAISRSLLIFSDVTFKMAAWRPYWIFWFPDSNFTLALNINFKLQRHNTYVYG